MAHRTPGERSPTGTGGRLPPLTRWLRAPSPTFNVVDFTFDAYERLLEAGVAADYEFLTVEAYLQAPEPPEHAIVVRHDVDRRPETAREMAEIEAGHGVRTTYYLRARLFEPAFARELEERGHEVGYHYEDLAAVGGDHAAAIERFDRNVERFRAHVDVSTVCPHGSPLSPHDNRDVWRHGASPADRDLLGDAGLSLDHDSGAEGSLRYFSDTGRTWGTEVPGFGRVSTTDDLIALVEDGRCDRYYVLAHPGRWARTRTELLSRVAWDLGAESGKVAARCAHRCLDAGATVSRLVRPGRSDAGRAEAE